MGDERMGTDANKVTNDVLSGDSRQKIDAWRTKFPEGEAGDRSAIIGALTIAQDQNDGWLSQPILDAVANYLEVPAIWVYEAASFYSMFFTQPVGRHKVSICANISCMLCGADDVIAHVEEKLGVQRGETTEDGRITLVKEEECLAACTGGPMMMVDGHYHENLTIEKVDELLDSLT